MLPTVSTPARGMTGQMGSLHDSSPGGGPTAARDSTVHMPRHAQLLLSGLVFILVALDRLTKLWAEQALSVRDTVPVIGEVMRLRLGSNAGVAFGLFPETRVFWGVLGSVLTLGLIGWFVFLLLGGSSPVPARWPVGMLIGGALGNVIDRFPDGRVTDFIDIGFGLTRWPNFNLADVWITVGVGSMLLLSLRASSGSSPDPRHQSSRHNVASQGDIE